MTNYQADCKTLEEHQRKETQLPEPRALAMYRSMDISSCHVCASICDTLDARHEHWKTECLFDPFLQKYCCRSERRCGHCRNQNSRGTDQPIEPTSSQPTGTRVSSNQHTPQRCPKQYDKETAGQHNVLPLGLTEQQVNQHHAGQQNSDMRPVPPPAPACEHSSLYTCDGDDQELQCILVKSSIATAGQAGALAELEEGEQIRNLIHGSSQHLPQQSSQFKHPVRSETSRYRMQHHLTSSEADPVADHGQSSTCLVMNPVFEDQTSVRVDR